MSGSGEGALMTEVIQHGVDVDDDENEGRWGEGWLEGGEDVGGDEDMFK